MTLCVRLGLSSRALSVEETHSVWRREAFGREVRCVKQRCVVATVRCKYFCLT